MRDDLIKSVKFALSRFEKLQKSEWDSDNLQLWNDLPNRFNGKNHACILDFDNLQNQKVDDQVKQKLEQPLKKASKEDYSNARVDLGIIGGLAGQKKDVKPNVKVDTLLSDEDSNAKTKKNKTQGAFASKILYLAPANSAGRGNTCPGLSAGCKESCLNTAGMGSMISEKNPVNTQHESRVKKTRYLADHPHDFLSHLDKEITSHKKSAQKNGDKPVVRLNGTSDVAWEHYKHPDWNGQNIFERHPDVQFYDYTKRPERVRGNKHDNYHLTFSLSESNHHAAKKLLEEGHNVAVPFGYHKNKFKTEEYETTAKMPQKHWGSDVIDGDKHDLRFLDAKADKSKGERGKIIGLRAKGDAIHDTSGFVQWGHEGAPNAKAKPRKEGAKPREQILRDGIKQVDEGKYVVPKSGGKKKKEEPKAEEPKTPEKLAASEDAKLKPGMSYNKLKKSEEDARNKGRGDYANMFEDPKKKPKKANGQKPLDAAFKQMEQKGLVPKKKEPVRCGKCHGTNPFNCGPECM